MVNRQISRNQHEHPTNIAKFSFQNPNQFEPRSPSDKVIKISPTSFPWRRASWDLMLAPPLQRPPSFAGRFLAFCRKISRSEPGKIDGGPLKSKGSLWNQRLGEPLPTPGSCLICQKNCRLHVFLWIIFTGCKAIHSCDTYSKCCEAAICILQEGISMTTSFLVGFRRMTLKSKLELLTKPLNHTSKPNIFGMVLHVWTKCR